MIKNKNRNRLQGQDFFEYDKYEKVELDINNIIISVRACVDYNTTVELATVKD